MRASSVAAPRIPRPVALLAACAALVVAAAAEQVGVASGHAQPTAPPFTFAHRGADAGFGGMTVFGGRETNRYLLETTGCGVAMFDYDADGLQDLFFVNGTTLEGFPKGQEPRPHLYRNTGGARFEDVTAAAGLNEQFGWGQGACAGDYDNDGFPDLFVTYYGAIASSTTPAAAASRR